MEKEDPILKLIKYIDRPDNAIQSIDAFKGENRFPIVALFLLITATVILLLFAKMDVVSIVVILLTLLVVSIGYLTFLGQTEEKNIIDVNLKRMWAFPNNDERPIFKALIIMKFKNKEFTLEQIYNMHREMFTKEKLLEMLYQ